jgi:hypothetical protein
VGLKLKMQNFIIKNAKYVLTTPPSDLYDARRSVIVFQKLTDAQNVNKKIHSLNFSSISWTQCGNIVILSKPTKQKTTKIQSSVHSVDKSKEKIICGHMHMDMYIVSNTQEYSDSLFIYGYISKSIQLQSIKSKGDLTYLRYFIEHVFQENDIQTFITHFQN